MAGVSTKEIRSRIRSMSSTRQITRAMEMVASSKLRRAQAQIQSSRPYFQIFSAAVDEILEKNRDFSSPYLRARTTNQVLYIAIAGDRGLAGGYNSNILNMVEKAVQGKNAVVLPIGKRSVEFFRSRKIPVFTESYAVSADLEIDDCFSIAKSLCDAFLAEQLDEVHIAYTHFDSVLSQIPLRRKLLPMIPKQNNAPTPRSDILYEPSPEEVFAALIPEYLGGILYGALCESRASEAAARRTAMEAATSNAGQMIDDLRLRFNRARQSAITQEITEIVAGS